MEKIKLNNNIIVGGPDDIKHLDIIFSLDRSLLKYREYNWKKFRKSKRKRLIVLI